LLVATPHGICFGGRHSHLSIDTGGGGGLNAQWQAAPKPRRCACLTGALLTTRRPCGWRTPGPSNCQLPAAANGPASELGARGSGSLVLVLVNLVFVVFRT
jgi:hypothetical protein